MPSQVTFQSSKQQFVYEGGGRLAANSQVGQEGVRGRIGSNRYQGVLSSQQSGGLQGGARQVQSFQSGAPQGAIASQHLALQKQQTEATEGTMVGKLEMPALKSVKSEYTGLGGVKAEYMIQDSLNQAASMRMSQDSAC